MVEGGKRETDYCFVPSSEGSRCVGLGGSAILGQCVEREEGLWKEQYTEVVVVRHTKF